MHLQQHMRRQCDARHRPLHHLVGFWSTLARCHERAHRCRDGHGEQASKQKREKTRMWWDSIMCVKRRANDCSYDDLRERQHKGKEKKHALGLFIKTPTFITPDSLVVYHAGTAKRTESSAADSAFGGSPRTVGRRSGKPFPVPSFGSAATLWAYRAGCFAQKSPQ